MPSLQYFNFVHFVLHIIRKSMMHLVNSHLHFQVEKHYFPHMWRNILQIREDSCNGQTSNLCVCVYNNNIITFFLRSQPNHTPNRCMVYQITLFVVQGTPKTSIKSLKFHTKLIQVDIGGHPPFSTGSKQFSGNFDNLLFLAGFNFRGHFEGLNEGFLRSRFSMIAKDMIEPPK
jgi:hypothetical protein